MSGAMSVVGSADEEAALVERLRGGERLAFRALYARYAQPTFAFLARLTLERGAAEDLHQETWLRVARHAHRLAPGTDLAAWIFTIARNTFRSARRRPERLVLARDGVAPVGMQVGAFNGDDPGCRDLERALRALPEASREVLVLVGVEGLSTRQAAEVLQLREDAVRQRLLRAREALLEAWGDADDAVASGGARRRAHRGRGGPR